MHRLEKVLRQTNWVPPHNWTRYLTLDPGTAHPAILMCAVPPPDLWDDGEPYHVVYREIYKPRLTAEELAKEVKATERGYVFQRFIIDGHAARQTPMGFSGTIGNHYSQAFAKHGLFCVETGSIFSPGDPNPVSRGMVVRSLLRMRPCGVPQLRIVNRNCPNLVRQLVETERQVTGDVTTEVPEKGQRIDVLVCLEYYASHYPTYVPVPEDFSQDPIVRALKEEWARDDEEREHNKQPTVLGGV